MNKIYSKLELDIILQRLEEKCLSPLGAELARSLQPARDLEVARRRLQATSEAEQVLRRYPDIPLSNIHDIRVEVARAAVGGLLEGQELLRVAATLAGGRRLRQFLLGLEGNWPVLREMATRIGDFRHLEKAIGQAIGADGEVVDQATPRLLALRQQVRKTQERIKERLDGYLRSAEMQKYLQDNLYTIRNDRYVLPIKQEYRHQVPGLIHDQSASGATLFIEPMALVELNNELRRLQAAEAREIEAILRHLSNLIGREQETLEITLAALGELDFTLAKGRLSQEMAAVEPRLNNEGRWHIYRGRHPLLKGRVVPVSLTLGEDFDTLVITGPNTGGKTVTLKTVGLFTLMAQCGLHLPAAAGTEVDPTAAVYADIGDEQSIEQSLSTFSAHMAQIVAILKEVTPGSLVLLDELGAGTDPTEGAALAMAILDYLTGAGARTVATTHYSELKAYAYATPRVENAAVEFDSRTLQPTYNLIIGTPGESNAFVIASRLGLSPTIIDRARSLLGEENQRVSRLIAGLAEDKRVSAREREEAEILRREAEAARAELVRAKEAWQQQAAREMEKVREEARGLLRRARAEIREIMARLEKAMAEESLRGQQQAVTRARRQLKELEDAVDAGLAQYRPAAPNRPPENLQAGDRVYLLAWGQAGEVLSPPNDQGEVLVQVGALKVTVPLKELRLLEDVARAGSKNGPKKEDTKPGWLVKAAGNDDIRPEIDLRGLTVEEACHRVDAYLDDAVLAGLNQVSLIHGKGTGALRAALQDYLRQHPLVKGFRLGGAGEGGSGVTVVDIGR
ncbi:Endonuclease MutS2 [Moorella glycerini]|uniref:Endonuclease MutS2 n=1 Tax=Neomoorella stamsii TaxID=1266720 RepID=A0A9X7J1M8_9FIRM|nr:MULTISPECIES: endonuclease MutS2 [Moorella]PRR71588.1 Endonuclease MutS2 [Moorella stamsii]CEP66145.1 Endonuclease MutS2 [Moorella glycerini]